MPGKPGALRPNQSLHWMPTFFPSGRARGESDGTRAETTVRLSPKRMSLFKSVGESVQPISSAEVCASALVMLDTPPSEVV